MAQNANIVNQIINSPFAEPQRHFKFDDNGITNETEEQRRISHNFIPIAQPKKRSKEQQQTFPDWTADRIEPNKLVNFIRQRVFTSAATSEISRQWFLLILKSLACQSAIENPCTGQQ